MNEQQYIKQLEENNMKQAQIIEFIRKANDDLVNKYNELIGKYNTVIDLLNACGVRETSVDAGGGQKSPAWCLTMQIGALPNPKEKLEGTGIDTNVTFKPIQTDGDVVKWGVSPT